MLTEPNTSHTLYHIRTFSIWQYYKKAIVLWHSLTQGTSCKSCSFLTCIHMSICPLTNDRSCNAHHCLMDRSLTWSHPEKRFCLRGGQMSTPEAVAFQSWWRSLVTLTYLFKVIRSNNLVILWPWAIFLRLLVSISLLTCYCSSWRIRYTCQGHVFVLLLLLLLLFFYFFYFFF